MDWSTSLEEIEPSDEVLAVFKRLPADAVRHFLDKLDWKSVRALCYLRPDVCRSYWQMRARQEFGPDSWIVAYQYPFHNYLAARVRWLSKQPKVNKYWQSPVESRYTLEDFGLVRDSFISKVESKTDPSIPTLKIRDAVGIWNKIASAERQIGYPVKVVDIKTNPLREYFGIKPTL